MSVIPGTETIGSIIKDIHKRLRSLESPGPALNQTSVNYAAQAAMGAGAVPSISPGGNNGTSPFTPFVAGTGLAGVINFGSGAGPTAGEQAIVTFSPTLTISPLVVFNPRNSATYDLGLYVNYFTGVYGISGFSVMTKNAPAASQGGTTYGLIYLISYSA